MSLETVILALGTEDDDRVGRLADTAADIAGPADATVSLVRVYDTDKYERLKDQLNFPPNSEATPDSIAGRDALAQDLSDSLSTVGIDTTVRGLLAEDDSPGERIVAFADRVGADLVIVGGRRRSPAGKAVFGSTAQTVLLNAPCPVIFVRGD